MNVLGCSAPPTSSTLPPACCATGGSSRLPRKSGLRE
jgi:hypothetical protein